MKTILYIHGMGGGADSRIPSILNGWFREHQPEIQVVVRTYDFIPDRAAEQIRAWYEELRPALVIGESLGGVHALALYGCGADASRSCGAFYPFGGMQFRLASAPQPANVTVPLLLVSPALNAPKFLYALRGAARIPAIHRLLNRIYKPREGQRQVLDFTPETLRAWGSYRNVGRPQEPGGPAPTPYAFFGRHDHYRRSGVVSLRQWQRRFGPDSYTCYNGSHYMEEEHLPALLIPAILERL